MEDSTTKTGLQVALDRVARANYGVLWTEMMLDLGASRAQIQKRVERRVLRRVARGIFVVSAVPHSWEQDLMITCRRAPGRVWIAGEAAGALMNLDGCRPGRIVAVTTANVRPRTSTELIKRVSTLPAKDVTVIQGLPVTSVDRTLIDLGDDLSVSRVELAYECAIRRGLTHPRRLKDRIEELGTAGRKGPSVLRWIIDVQGKAAPTGSVLEVMFLQLNRHAGLPTPIRQRVFKDVNGHVMRVDFIYPRTNVVVEVDGRSFHLRRLKWEEDLERRNRLTASGLKVLHVTYRRMKDDPDGVLAEIERALVVK